MNTLPSFWRFVMGATLSLTLAMPALAAETKPVASAKPAAKAAPAAKPTAKPTAKPAAKPAAKSSSKSTTAKGKSSAPAEQSDAIKTRLDEFAAKTIASINRCVIPSCNKKEVQKNADGTFTARYIEIDSKTLETSYKKPESSKSVSYIGYMSYVEVEYVCTAGTQKAALAGPFAASRREHMTELVKYMKGKWTY